MGMPPGCHCKRAVSGGRICPLPQSYKLKIPSKPTHRQDTKTLPCVVVKQSVRQRGANWGVVRQLDHLQAAVEMLQALLGLSGHRAAREESSDYQVVVGDYTYPRYSPVHEPRPTASDAGKEEGVPMQDPAR